MRFSSIFWFIELSFVPNSLCSTIPIRSDGLNEQHMKSCSNSSLTQCPCPTGLEKTEDFCGNEITGDKTLCLSEGVYVCDKGNIFACLHKRHGDCGAKGQYCDLTRDLSSMGLKFNTMEQASAASSNTYKGAQKDVGENVPKYQKKVVTHRSCFTDQGRYQPHETDTFATGAGSSLQAIGFGEEGKGDPRTIRSLT